MHGKGTSSRKLRILKNAGLTGEISLIKLMCQTRRLFFGQHLNSSFFPLSQLFNNHSLGE